MIQVKDIHVTFNPGTVIETQALRGLALTIPDGQFVTMIGSNGSGKSTFLNVLAGEVLAERGQVVVGEVDVTTLPTSERASLVSRVFQDPMAGTCEGLTIEENLALAQVRGQSRQLRLAIGKDLRERFRDRLAWPAAGDKPGYGDAPAHEDTVAGRTYGGTRSEDGGFRDGLDRPLC